MLTALGVTDLITYNTDDYFKTALELATDHNKLSAIRNKLKTIRSNSRLFDNQIYARNLERAFIAMHDHHTQTRMSANT